MNVYVLAKVVPDVSLMEIFKGVVPFVVAALAVPTVLGVFPD